MTKMSHLLAIAAAIASISATAQNEFFVSPQGADINPGTRQQPFKSITRARDAVRRINQNMREDITVSFGSGFYPIERTIEFTSADSGMNGHRVIYQAFEGNTPVLSGATKVTGWTQYNGAIYEAHLDHPRKLRTLIVNGKRAYMAHAAVESQGKWGTYKVVAGQADWAWISGSTADGMRFNADDLPLLKNPEDVEVMRSSTWNTHIVGIRGIETSGASRILKFQQPAGAIALHQNWGNYNTSGEQTIVNAFEFLDEPGEFYFDRKSKTLYYYSDGENMATAEVYAPRIEGLISIQGTSTNDRVSNLSFKGLTFAHSEAILPQIGESVGKTTVQAATWCVAFDNGNWHTTQYRAYDTMPNAVHVSSAQSIQFSDNVFKHIGNEGIGFINDVSDTEFTGNLCYDIGGSAIQVGHPQHVYIGDTHEHAIYAPEVEGVCKNILVENNVLYDMTTLFYGHAAITAYFSDGLHILKNHIQDTNYTAVSIGWAWNNFDEISKPGNPTTTCRNNRFNNNRVYNCMKMLHDGGAFYTLGSQPNSQANGNYVKAATTNFQGVYHPDEGTAWYTGKDLVFEIIPGQDNFELNKWKRKHDNHYSNIYSTSESQRTGAPNCTITDLHVYPDADWPEAALAIIRAAGPDPEYQHLLDVIPDLIFEPGKRYDTKELVVDPKAPIIHVPPTDEGKYEAEQATLSGSAQVNADHPGFSGTGFVGGYYNSSSAKTTFSVEVPDAGTYTATLRYAAGHQDSKNMVLSVNGEESSQLTCKSTGKWNVWANHKESVFLNRGLNTISIKPESPSPDSINIDYIQITR